MESWRAQLAGAKIAKTSRLLALLGSYGSCVEPKDREPNKVLLGVCQAESVAVFSLEGYCNVLTHTDLGSWYS